MKPLFKTVIVRNEEDLEKTTNFLLSSKFIAIDTETTGLSRKDKIVGISLSGNSSIGYYIPMRHITYNLFSDKNIKQLPVNIVANYVNKILNSDANILAWNWKFDYKMLKKENMIKSKGKVIDVMLMAHLIDENKTKILKDRAHIDLGVPVQFLKNITTTDESGNKDYNFAKIDIEVGAPYAVQDVVLPILLFDLYRKEFELGKSFANILNMELELPEIIAAIEDYGILIDYNKANKINDKIKEEIVLLEDKMNKLVGTINFKSSQQLTNLLYTKGYLDKNGKRWIKLQDDRLFKQFSFGLTPLKFTDGQSPSTDVDALSKIKMKLLMTNKRTKKQQKCLDFVSLLSDYKFLEKKYDSFIKPLIKSNSTVVRASYLQAGTRSGRFSAKNPNIHQLPKLPGKFDIRSCYIARPGKIIYKIDWSAMEMKLAAALSNDKKMMEVVASSDPHAATASLIFEKPIEEISDFERDVGKTINFSILFGAGPQIIAERIMKADNRDLSKQIPFKTYFENAKNYIKKYYENYNGLKAWNDKLEVELVSSGYVTTYFGRRRHVPKHPSPKQLRSAKNSPVQGCMAYNTTINLDINGVKTVEEVFNDKLYVSNKVLTDKGYMPFLVKYSGRKYVYEFVTEIGSIFLTLNHRIPIWYPNSNKFKVKKFKDIPINSWVYNNSVMTTKGLKSWKSPLFRKPSCSVDTYDIIILSYLTCRKYVYCNNILIHNSGSDILKKSLCEIYTKLPKNSHILTTIHDEFVIETTLEELEEVDKLCHKVMEVTINGIKLNADATWGYSMSKSENNLVEDK